MDNNKIANFIVNEVLPRAKKLGIPAEEFAHPNLTAFFVKSEEEGCLYRYQTRKYLNQRFEELKAKAVGGYGQEKEEQDEAEFDKQHPGIASFFTYALACLDKDMPRTK